MVDLQPRQSLLFFFQCGVGDLCADDVEALELGQRFEVEQPLIANLGAVESKPGEVGQPLDVVQSGVGKLRSIEIEVPELGQSVQMR